MEPLNTKWVFFHKIGKIRIFDPASEFSIFTESPSQIESRDEQKRNSLLQTLKSMVRLPLPQRSAMCCLWCQDAFSLNVSHTPLTEQIARRRSTVKRNGNENCSCSDNISPGFPLFRIRVYVHNRKLYPYPTVSFVNDINCY